MLQEGRMAEYVIRIVDSMPTKEYRQNVDYWVSRIPP